MSCRHVLLLALCLHFSAACVPVRPGEDMPCPSVPQASVADGYNVKPLVKKPNENGAMVYGCNPPDMMLSVTGSTPTVLPDAEAKISCQPNSGIFTDSKGMAVGSKTYACGTEKLPCQTCDMAKILETSNGACSTQGSIFCTSKPTVTPDAMMCPTLSCGTDALYLLTTSTASMLVADPASVKCDAGTWMSDGAPLAGTEVGFACGKVADCAEACDAKVQAAFTPTPGAVDFANIVQPNNMRPACVYKCPTDMTYALLINGMGAKRSSVQCQYEAPNAVTADGQALAAADKFECVACTCMASDFNTGDALCDPDMDVCVAPKPGMPCEGTCPTGSTPRYQDTSAAIKSATSPFSCLRSTWIDPNINTGAGITCVFPQSTNFPTTPDAPTGCAALPVQTCANPTDCDPSQVIYVPNGDGVIAMCKQGQLVTSNANIMNFAACENGAYPVTAANCDTSANPTAMCIAGMSMINPANLEASCKFGVCTVKCKTAGEKVHYTVGGVAQSTAFVRCVDNTDIYAPDGGFIDDAMMAMCAP